MISFMMASSNFTIGSLDFLNAMRKGSLFDKPTNVCSIFFESPFFLAWLFCSINEYRLRVKIPRKRYTISVEGLNRDNLIKIK